MPHTLAFDFASSSFDVLRERAERSPNGSPDATQELLDNCEVPFLLLERLWRSVQEALDRGVEKQKFMGLLKDCLGLLEQAPRALGTVRDQVRAAALPPKDQAAGLALLDRLEQDAAKKRDELTALQRWLEMPRPDIDPSKLPVPAKGREAPGFTDHDEFMRRFLSGGDE